VACYIADVPLTVIVEVLGEATHGQCIEREKKRLQWKTKSCRKLTCKNAPDFLFVCVCVCVCVSITKTLFARAT
jgi:hypothetical protein